MSRIRFIHKYKDIIAVENLLEAWKEFLTGKKSRKDVQEFQRQLMSNILALHQELKDKTYTHGNYEWFSVNDPKPRDIHKAKVKDRVVHRVIYRVLYPFFAKTFIADSFSCQVEKGIHRSVRRFNELYLKVSKNKTEPVWVLKCDIRKFFDSIDHEKLLDILQAYIPDKEIINLLRIIIGSFYKKEKGVGLPLGNLTSQLFVNIYMNKFDQFIKHQIKAGYYIRYAEDFVILSDNRDQLLDVLPKIRDFLDKKLQLVLHPNKVSIEKFASGVDFLGWVNFPDHKVLRTSTKRKMFRRLAETDKAATAQSYLGLLSHGNGYKLATKIKNSVGNLG